jgi:hypothetical protein
MGTLKFHSNFFLVMKDQFYKRETAELTRLQKIRLKVSRQINTYVRGTKLGHICPYHLTMNIMHHGIFMEAPYKS